MEKLQKFYQKQVYNPDLADSLLSLINVKYAIDRQTWFYIAGNHRTAGGTLEAFKMWSSVGDYDMQKASDALQMENGWKHSEGKYGMGCLIYYARESGNGLKAEEMEKEAESSSIITAVPILPKAPVYVPPSPEVIAKTIDNLSKLYTDMTRAELEAELSRRSPHQPEGGLSDTIALLSLYEQDDLLYLPFNSFSTEKQFLKAVHEWPEALKSWYRKPQYIIMNTHIGQTQPTQDGKPSLRANECFNRKFCLIEFDNMPIEKQLKIWLGLLDRKCVVSALIYSGGKSIHAWIPATTEAQVSKIYNFMIPLGCDSACRNLARLSRLAGVERENRAEQKLLYLNSKSTKKE